MDWSEIVDNPHLRDLPFKIEQDRYGNILMSPASNRHNRLQVRIAKGLERQIAGGEAFVECSIQTGAGVKVADVVWQSEAHYAQHGDTTPMASAPEICVEVLSPSNTRDEIDEKRTLYLAAGAREVWLCQPDGAMRHFTPEGEVEASPLAPGFPKRID